MRELAARSLTPCGIAGPRVLSRSASGAYGVPMNTTTAGARRAPLPVNTNRRIDVSWTDYPRTMDFPTGVRRSVITGWDIATDTSRSPSSYATLAKSGVYLDDGQDPGGVPVISFDEVEQEVVAGSRLAAAIRTLDRAVVASGIEGRQPNQDYRRMDPLPGGAFVTVWDPYSDSGQKKHREWVVDNYAADPELLAIVRAARTVHNLVNPQFPDRGRYAHPERT